MISNLRMLGEFRNSQLVELFAGNPRLVKEDVLSIVESDIPERARSLKTEVLLFMSPEGICLGQPHPAIPRDERGRLIWPTSSETPAAPETPATLEA